MPLSPSPISPGGREGGRRARLTLSGAAPSYPLGRTVYSWSRGSYGSGVWAFQPAFGVGGGAIPSFGSTSLTIYVRGFGAPLTSLSGAFRAQSRVLPFVRGTFPFKGAVVEPPSLLRPGVTLPFG